MFDFESICSRRKIERDLAATDEVIVPEREFVGSQRFAIGVLEVYATRQQLARRLVHDGDLDTAHCVLRAGDVGREQTHCDKVPEYDHPMAHDSSSVEEVVAHVEVLVVR